MLNVDTGDCDSPLTEMEMAMAFKEVTEKFDADHKVSLPSSIGILYLTKGFFNFNIFCVSY